MKHPKELERICRSFANSWRIKTLELLEKEGDMTLSKISEKLTINFKTASSHANRLNLAELISKKYSGNTVVHKITNRGKSILKFLRILE